MNVETFLDLLGQSGLVSEEQLDTAYHLLEENANSPEFQHADWIGQELQNRGMITAWQCRQLLKGKYKGFFIRKYRLLGLLGIGGMGSVYLAEHTVMQRRVAIKVLPRDRQKKGNYLDHFIREAQVIATLDHPNIIRAYDIDIEGDVHYIVMEFFEGIDLQRKVLKDGPLTVPMIVDYVRQAAEALHYAHQVGIIHRDIKPANLLVNARNQVKLLDLGLALIDPSQYSGHLSTDHRESSILGTADYLAPEQAINSQKVDFRADIYALGGVLYFCLTGHPPFPTGSVSERLLAHQLKNPTSILIDRPNTSDDLVQICEKMMSKDPNVRQQSAAEVALDLQNWLIEHGHTGNRDTWTVRENAGELTLNKIQTSESSALSGSQSKLRSASTSQLQSTSQSKSEPQSQSQPQSQSRLQSNVKAESDLKTARDAKEKEESLFEEKTAFDLSPQIYGIADSNDPLIQPPATFDCEGKTDSDLEKKLKEGENRTDWDRPGSNIEKTENSAKTEKSAKKVKTSSEELVADAGPVQQPVQSPTPSRSALPTVSSNATKRIVIQSNPRASRSQTQSTSSASSGQLQRETRLGSPVADSAQKRSKGPIRQQDMDDEMFDAMLNNFLAAPQENRSTSSHSVNNEVNDRSTSQIGSKKGSSTESDEMSDELSDQVIGRWTGEPEKRRETRVQSSRSPKTADSKVLNRNSTIQGIEMKRVEHQDQVETARPVVVERPPLPREKWYEKVPLWGWGLLAIGTTLGLLILTLFLLAR
ncbi:MAG: serine/threonine protein kinase [Thermoguttaceae bacterium]